jgi:hypothetical protein
METEGARMFARRARVLRSRKERRALRMTTNKKRGLGGPRSFLSLYIYFIKLGGVNRTGFQKYFPNWDKGLAGIGVGWGLDRKLGRGG